MVGDDELAVVWGQRDGYCIVFCGPAWVHHTHLHVTCVLFRGPPWGAPHSFAFNLFFCMEPTQISRYNHTQWQP